MIKPQHLVCDTQLADYDCRLCHSISIVIGGVDGAQYRDCLVTPRPFNKQSAYDKLLMKFWRSIGGM